MQDYQIFIVKLPNYLMIILPNQDFIIISLNRIQFFTFNFIKSVVYFIMAWHYSNYFN